METAIDAQAPQLLHRQRVHEHQLQQMSSKVKKRKHLSLENYLAFLQNRHHQNLNVTHLNQIISIHGFKKLKSTGRKVLEETLGELKLITPARSTLNDNVSSKTVVSLEEAIKDLAALSWQECSITSIKSINSLNYVSPSETATKSTNPKAKRSKSSTKSATSLSSGDIGSGSSSMNVKVNKRSGKEAILSSSLALSMRSGENGSGSASGSACSSLVVAEEGKREVRRKRKTMKRLYNAQAVAPKDALS